MGFGVLSYGVVFLVKYLPGVLEAALGLFGIMGGPVLGAFVLGMFVPYCNELVSRCVLTALHRRVTQGAFTGTFTSLIFTMWMGFGQTVAKQAGTYDSSRWARKFPTSMDNCPDSWLNGTEPLAKEPFTPFTHLELYEVAAVVPSCSHLPLHQVSYMWFSAVACLWCVVVGSLVSLVR